MCHWPPLGLYRTKFTYRSHSNARGSGSCSFFLVDIPPLGLLGVLDNWPWPRELPASKVMQFPTWLPLQEVLGLDGGDLGHSRKDMCAVGRGPLHAVTVIYLSLAGFLVHVKLGRQETIWLGTQQRKLDDLGQAVAGSWTPHAKESGAAERASCPSHSPSPLLTFSRLL